MNNRSLANTTVLIIGAGPTRIGQSGECDAGAVEAAMALNAAGCRIIALDSNPDAVLTDLEDVVTAYVEPLQPDDLEEIIRIEKPDAILPIFGGRPGLHLIEQWNEHPLHTTAQPEVWGSPAASLAQVLDKDGLRSALAAIQLQTLNIFTVADADEAAAKAQSLEYPVVLRCDDPDILVDGVMVYNQDELRASAAAVTPESGVSLSVEASLMTWQQIEVEMLRDKQGQTILAGAVEYVDSAGIHPGDAIAVFPTQTVPDDILAALQTHARRIVDHLGIVGCATIRFALQSPGRPVLITAVHPRYTRTSAMVERATGMPIASLAALLAAGLTWDQVPEHLTPSRMKQINPNLVAVKWPCWAFDRLTKVTDRLGPQMQALGQALGLGSTFEEAFHKAMRAADTDRDGFSARESETVPALPELLTECAQPTSRRQFTVYEALKQNANAGALAAVTHIAPWFIERIQSLTVIEAEICRFKGVVPPEDLLRKAKCKGFADSYLARLLDLQEADLRSARIRMGVTPGWLTVSRPVGPDGALRYAAYDSRHTAKATTTDKHVVIIGNGPVRIGRGLECDHAIFHAAGAAKAMGFTPVVVNNSLTSITTGHGGPGACFCDVLCPETIQAVADALHPMGIVTQFAAPSIVRRLHAADDVGAPLLGLSAAQLQVIHDRAALRQQFRQLGIPQPLAAQPRNMDEARKAAETIGYPLWLHRTGVRSDLPLQLVLDKESLDAFFSRAGADDGISLFMESFLEYAIEAQVDVLCDGEDVFVAPVVEHIELAGVHAGDSAWVVPPYSIAPRHIETINDYAMKCAMALGIRGLLNLRFAVYRDTVYLLDASCDICRDLALMQKSAGLSLADWSIRVLLGNCLRDLPLKSPQLPYFSVRSAVFPFNVFTQEDPLLGPQMKSTGSVLALSASFGMAYFKALEAAANPLPTEGTVLITVTDEDKASILEPARVLQEQGFNIKATQGTRDHLAEHGIEATLVNKLGFGRPNLVDDMKNGQVQMVINTPSGDQSHQDDSYIRTTAIRRRIANITTPASAVAAAKGIAARRQGRISVAPIKLP
ncbi:MAG: carbamoyl-phosphate synthase large subunit [Desulfatitalea sp.]|nr:carbamoyl-phosphate synthase large subunit [Desulfatitalea sp.]NNJ99314.1 carbamoyl-phosphate synthase large subunit [Desulfatitalea sp.]